MAKHVYLAKSDAPKNTPSPVWAEEVGNTRRVKTGGKVASGPNKGQDVYKEAQIGDMVFTTDLGTNHGQVMSKANFDAIYERKP